MGALLWHSLGFVSLRSTDDKRIHCVIWLPTLGFAGTAWKHLPFGAIFSQTNSVVWFPPVLNGPVAT
jgi:hypothetical protein